MCGRRQVVVEVRQELMEPLQLRVLLGLQDLPKNPAQEEVAEAELLLPILPVPSVARVVLLEVVVEVVDAEQILGRVVPEEPEGTGLVMYLLGSRCSSYLKLQTKSRYCCPVR